SSLICELKKDDKITFTRSGNAIKILKNATSIGSHSKIYVIEKKINSHFTIQCLLPSNKKARKYMNNLELSTEGTEKIKVVNLVEMPNYLAGVIESEGGGGKHIEYYKVQAILSRPYALDHLQKH